MTSVAAARWLICPATAVRVDLPAEPQGAKAVLFEFRHYTCKPGQRDAWVQYMEEVVIPFQASKGMVILGSFRGEGDDDSYYWIRRFADEAERERQYAAVYQSDEWRDVIGPRVPEMIDREAIKVTRMVPTAKSVIQ